MKSLLHFSQRPRHLSCSHLKTDATIRLDMMQGILLFLPALLTFGFGLFLALWMDHVYLAIPFLWIGIVQILNRRASYLPGTQLIQWIRAMTLEIFALLGVPFLRLTQLYKKEQGIGKGQPILLVHGYLNHGTVWHVFKKRLEILGFGPIYTIDLGHPFQSISTYAEKVKKKAEWIAEQTKREDLILIGHSMGGVVSCYYALYLALPSTVTHVITIGSPLFGTFLARIGMGCSAREMLPDSPLLKELRSLVIKNKEIHFKHIITKTDQIVFSSSFFPDHEYMIFEDMGHASLLYSKRVVQKIADWLQSSTRNRS